MKKYTKDMKFGPYQLHLTPARSIMYNKSIGIYGDSNINAPLLPVAVALGNLLQDLDIGIGAVHLLQEVTLHMHTQQGQSVTALSHIKHVKPSRDGTVLVISTNITDEINQLVCSAVSTVRVKV